MKNLSLNTSQFDNTSRSRRPGLASDKKSAYEAQREAIELAECVPCKIIGNGLVGELKLGRPLEKRA